MPTTISIVVPTLNQARHLPACLQSLLSQAGDFELEVLVRDGGSTDETLEILKQIADPRLRWISESDRGQAHAINLGLGDARGEIVAYLNSDDLYLPGALNTAVQAFKANPGAQWLCGRCRIVDENDRPRRSFIMHYKWFLLRPWRPWKMLLENYIPQPSVFLRKSAWLKLGPFDESLHYAMDYDYWLRMSRKYPLLILDRELAAFRVHAESKTGAGKGIEPSFREAHSVSKKHARAWGMIWASWINYWYYYVRTTLIYHIIK